MPSQSKVAVFKSRLPARAATAPNGTPLSRLAYAVDAAIGIHDRFEDARASINGNATLSDIGKAAALQQPVREYVAKLRNQVQEVQKASADIANRRMQFKPKAPDPSDIAGALL